MSGGGGGGAGGRLSAVKMAQMLSMREKAKWPRADYGVIHNRRGTETSLARFGETYRTASADQKANRTLVGYSGRGKYSFGQLAKDYKKSGIGKYVNPVLGAASRRAVSMIDPYGGSGMYTGRGEYVHSNNLVSGSVGDMIHRTSVPSAMSMGDETGAVIITHREYITDIFGPPAGNSFVNQSFSLNPGLEQTFPFLSQIAGNYDEYDFVQLVWEYRSTTTDIGNSSTGQCGTIIMCTNYNAAAPPFHDKGIMMEYAHAQSCKVTEHMVHGVECDPSKSAGTTISYTRTSPVISNQDIKTYDIGLFQLAIANSPPAYANLPIGELWVQYSVRLRKPKLFSSRGLDTDKDEYIVSAALGTVFTNTSFFFGSANNTTYASAQQNNIGCMIRPGIQTSYTGTTNPSQVTATTGGLSVVIPAGYNGNLRLSLFLGGASLASTLAETAITAHFLGNVSPIYDIYSGVNPATPGGSPTNILVTLTGSEIIVICDVYVRQATGIVYNAGSVFPNGTAYSGGDNVVVFTGMNGATGGSFVYASLQVEQYQPLGGLSGITSSAARVQFVNQSGALVLP